MSNVLTAVHKVESRGQRGSGNRSPMQSGLHTSSRSTRTPLSQILVDEARTLSAGSGLECLGCHFLPAASNPFSARTSFPDELFVTYLRICW